MPMPLSALNLPATDATPIFEQFRGSYATELLTAAVSAFNVFGKLAAGPCPEDDFRRDLGLAERPAVVLFTSADATRLAVGDHLDLHLEPEDAFGDFDEHLIHLAARHLLPAELEEGMRIEGSSLPPACCPEAARDAVYTVSEIYPEHIILDGNHPLAGIAIRLSLQVRGVREATAEEQERGSLGVGFFSLG